MELWGAGRSDVLDQIRAIKSKNYDDLTIEEINFMIDVGFNPKGDVFSRTGVSWEKTGDREFIDRLWYLLNLPARQLEAQRGFILSS
jgi:hypothetical protein